MIFMFYNPYILYYYMKIDFTSTNLHTQTFTLTGNSSRKILLKLCGRNSLLLSKTLFFIFALLFQTKNKQIAGSEKEQKKKKNTQNEEPEWA